MKLNKNKQIPQTILERVYLPADVIHFFLHGPQKPYLHSLEILNMFLLPTIRISLRKLRSRDWSVIYFAPGACRFDAAKRPIPGGNSQTKGWTLEQYRKLVREYQGDSIQIVETPEESEAISLLNDALAMCS